MMTKMMTTKMDDDDEVQFHSPKCKYPRDTSWIYFSLALMLWFIVLDEDKDDDDNDNNKDDNQDNKDNKDNYD